MEIDLRTGETGVNARFGWATDLHLDAASESARQHFIHLANGANIDGLLLAGDMSNGTGFQNHLEVMAHSLEMPIYFVLGNHDFYGSTISGTRLLAQSVTQDFPSLTYLSHVDSVELGPGVALLGHDCWADGREGDFFASQVMLNDYFYIEDLAEISREERLKRMQKIADEGVTLIENRMRKAFESYSKVVVLCHVPPYRESCLYENKVAGDAWAPHFICGALGEMLSKVMQQYTDRQALVLCGHSHHRALFAPLPNLSVITGGSELGEPLLQDVLLV